MIAYIIDGDTFGNGIAEYAYFFYISHVVHLKTNLVFKIILPNIAYVKHL